MKIQHIKNQLDAAKSRLRKDSPKINVLGKQKRWKVDHSIQKGRRKRKVNDNSRKQNTTDLVWKKKNVQTFSKSDQGGKVIHNIWATLGIRKKL